METIIPVQMGSVHKEASTEYENNVIDSQQTSDVFEKAIDNYYV